MINDNTQECTLYSINIIVLTVLPRYYWYYWYYWHYLCVRDVVAVALALVGDVGDPKLCRFKVNCCACCCEMVVLCNWIRHTCVCSLVRPLIHRICPVRFTSCDSEPLLPSSTSDEPASIISSGGPEPQVNCLGIRFVGIVVISCPHRRTPAPNKTHHIHCSTVSAAVLKGRPPNCTITICKHIKQ